MEPQSDMAVAVERGIITWMGPTAVAQAPAGAEVIDLGGAYLMPGLINMRASVRFRANRSRQAMRAR